MIGAVGVVLHPGSAKQGDVSKAIERAGKVIREALAQSEDCQLHLEDTAGAGGTLGRSFEELAALLDASGGDGRLSVCLDSCHLLASGYDIRTTEGLSDTLDEFVEVGQSGVVTTWAWVSAPRETHPFDHPFAWALIRLDGSDTAMLHAVDAGSEDRMSTGMRVSVKWRDERVGEIQDIACFVPEDGD